MLNLRWRRCEVRSQRINRIKVNLFKKKCFVSLVNYTKVAAFNVYVFYDLVKVLAYEMHKSDTVLAVRGLMKGRCIHEIVHTKYTPCTGRLHDVYPMYKTYRPFTLSIHNVSSVIYGPMYTPNLTCPGQFPNPLYGTIHTRCRESDIAWLKSRNK